MAKGVPELYGSLVFNDRVMRDKLPKDIYKALQNGPWRTEPPISLTGSSP